MKTVRPSPLLNLALRLDAIVSGTTAVVQWIGAKDLAPLFGLPAPLLQGSGAFMMVYALTLWVMASRARLPSWTILIVVAGNLAWAMACLALPTLIPAGTTAMGGGFLLLHAAGVTVFAILQGLGLRRSASAPGSRVLREDPAPGSAA